MDNLVYSHKLVLLQATTNNLEVTGSVTISSSVVDLIGATAISGSTFSGSFVGSGARFNYWFF